MFQLLRTKSLKKIDNSSPNKDQLSIATQLALGVCAHLPLYAESVPPLSLACSVPADTISVCSYMQLSWYAALFRKHHFLLVIY